MFYHLKKFTEIFTEVGYLQKLLVIRVKESSNVLILTKRVLYRDVTGVTWGQEPALDCQEVKVFFLFHLYTPNYTMLGHSLHLIKFKVSDPNSLCLGDFESL